ncbi:hypothetical protein RRG08_052018 [Elysia crispata]|uniref:Uncharacterized protein n=1 Tax=Elysia crispata TaxID=231223 RepID=A0AAE1CZ91_9GAST|nr:hypothetical protein RRG08_052018 [Elysia crispata]
MATKPAPVAKLALEKPRTFPSGNIDYNTRAARSSGVRQCGEPETITVSAQLLCQQLQLETLLNWFPSVHSILTPGIVSSTKSFSP